MLSFADLLHGVRGVSLLRIRMRDGRTPRLRSRRVQFFYCKVSTTAFPYSSFSGCSSALLRYRDTGGYVLRTRVVGGATSDVQS